MLPPSPPQLPVQQVIEWVRRPYPYFDRCWRDLGDIFTLRIPQLGPVVVVAHPEGVKEVFAQTPEAAHAGKANIVLKPFLGEHSLLLLDGAEHQRHRRMMMPAFHGDRMAAYGRTMLDITDEEIDRLPVGEPYAIHEALQRITLRVILRTVFGVADGPRSSELADLLTRSLAVLSWPPLLWPQLHVDLGPWSPWGYFLRISARVSEILRAEIHEARRPGRPARSDILSMLVDARDEAGQALTDQELMEELVTLLVAGHETTATSLAWALRWILPEPAQAARLREEAWALGAEGLEPGSVARSELLDGAVKEALRMIPVVPLVGRVMQRPVRILGYELPVGIRVAPSIYLVHRRPELYPDPGRFDPDRYRTFRPGPWEFLPFGGGFRRCIGAAFAVYEMKMVLAALFRRLTMRLAPGYEPRMVRRSITITPSQGLPVVITSRMPSRRRAA